MKTIPQRVMFLLLISFVSTNVFSQIYGPEQIPLGNFGTIETQGQNDGGGAANNIYPTVAGIGTTIPYYYQPAKQVYHNGNLVYIDVNPRVTIGKPIPQKTSYIWGMNEIWDTTPYYFPSTTDQPTSQIVPHAPNNGYYLITTSTRGMYELPSLANKNWATMFDRYETDTDNPTNYFLAVNADVDRSKIFYKEQVDIVPGQAYRMSVDIARLNTVGANPNISFIINSQESQLSTVTPIYSTGEVRSAGVWENFSFDYVPACDAGNQTFVAFRNETAGGNGNDLALDNLSMKAIIPQIRAEQGDCNTISFAMLDEAIDDAFPAGRYQFQWQMQESDLSFSDISGATTTQIPITTEGTYRLSVFTSATEGCRMYSNAIIISRNQGGCLDIAIPIAVNDTVDMIFNTVATGNVINNDQTSDPDVIAKDRLSVSNFTIAGQTYAAGSSANIYDAQNDKIGVITLNSNGDFRYEAVQGKFGRVPDITYTLSEEDAGNAIAVIVVNYVSYEAILDASCTSCPINLDVISPFDNLASEYYLLDADSREQVVRGEIIGDTIRFNFREERSGRIYFIFQADSRDLMTFPIQIAPAEATWAPNLIVQSEDWNLQLNWIAPSGRGFPIWCTDVTIPGDAPYYPTLNDEFDSDYGQCRDITFKEHASVGRIHKLYYRRAFVELTPIRQNWMMLNAPLKYTYSADFQADPTWGDKASVNPPIYMRYFDIRYSADTLTSIPNPDGTRGVSVGNFSRSFANLKERLELTKGFALKIDDGTNNTFDGTYKFPRLNADSTEVLFKYHYRSTGNWIEDTDTNVSPEYHPFRFTDAGQPGRGTEEMPSDSMWIVYNRDFDGVYNYEPRGKDNRYRFIYERSDSPSEVQPFTITVDNAGTTNIIGNPFMSHLDFETFSRMNVDNIEPYYRIWDGNAFHSYMRGGIDNGTWQGLPPVGTDPTAVGSRYIAPMQSFFVQMKAGRNQLIFNPDSISVAASDSINNNKLRSLPLNSVRSNNVLRINLEMNKLKNVAVVGVLPLASDNYVSEEDVYKLFSYDPKRPEIYTVVENQAIEINAVSNQGVEKSIPVGIRTTETGSFTIKIEGTEDFDAYPYIYLTDATENKRYNLKEQNSFTFSKKEGEKTEGRFYIVLRSDDSWTGIDRAENDNSATIIVNGQTISVSSPMYEIEHIELYDVSGRSVYINGTLNSLSHTFNVPVKSGVFIMKVKTTAGQKTHKVKI